MTPLEIICDVASTTARRHRDEGRTRLADQIDEAIAAIEPVEATAEPAGWYNEEVERLIDHACSLALGYGASGRDDVLAEYREAKAQAVGLARTHTAASSSPQATAEPVAWRYMEPNTHSNKSSGWQYCPINPGHGFSLVQPLYASPRETRSMETFPMHTDVQYADALTGNSGMKSADFIKWREKMSELLGERVSKSRAAELLGVSRNMPAKYESGEAEIPLTVALACAALLRKIQPYPVVTKLSEKLREAIEALSMAQSMGRDPRAGPDDEKDAMNKIDELLLEVDRLQGQGDG